MIAFKNFVRNNCTKRGIAVQIWRTFRRSFWPLLGVEDANKLNRGDFLFGVVFAFFLLGVLSFETFLNGLTIAIFFFRPANGDARVGVVEILFMLWRRPMLKSSWKKYKENLKTMELNKSKEVYSYKSY